MTTAEFTPIDACLQAAALRGDQQAEAQLEAAAAELRDRKLAVENKHPGAVALWYANRGLAVFPLTPDSKKPLPGSHGLNDATTDAETVRARFANVPWDANIGVATGGPLDAWDIDTAEGEASWIELVSGNRCDWLDIRGITKTPRGYHIWVPAHPESRNTANFRPGIDYRGRGGYVVVPPSVVDAGIYRWLLPPIL